MLKLFKELKRRKVIKTLGVYGAAALVIINLATSVFPYLNLPDWMVTFVIVLVILGFPITFFLSWTYDLKPEAEIDDKSVYENVGSDKKSKNMLLPITGLLTIIGGAFWVWYSLGSVSHGLDMDKKIFQSIAVLYLENLSNDPNDENICAGLTTSITTALSRLGRYKVKARTDVLKFRNKITGHKEINEILGVDAYIEGSIIKPPGSNKYNANITLIDAEKGNNLWAEEYSKTAEEILTIPSTVVSEVSKFLSGGEIAEIPPLEEINIQGDDGAFSLLGKGINLLDSGDYDRSIPVFDSLLLKEPDNIRAMYSKGQALEGLDRYADAIDSYNQILIDDNPISRSKNIWSYLEIAKYDLKNINILGKSLVSIELNIQIVGIYKKDQNISEIHAIDLNTEKIIWKRTYPFSIGNIAIAGKNVVLTTATLVRGGNEAAVYVHSMETGKRLCSKEFSKEHSTQRVLISILVNKGADIPIYGDAVYLYVRRDEYYSLVMIDPVSGQTVFEKIIPAAGVVEGDPLIYLVEDGEKNYLFHKKGLNQYLFEIKSGQRIWEKALLDDSYHVKIQNNLMLIYSNNNTDVVIQNIISQKKIGDYGLEATVERGFFWKDNIIINTKNSITSLKTYKPFLRGLHNWTQPIDNSDEIRWITSVHNNLFSFTKSGDLYCLNGKTGEIIHHNQIGHDIDSFHYEGANDPGYSPSKSYIIYANGFLIGLDTNNGKTLWKIRELNINEYRLYGHIIPIGNKVIIVKKPENENYVILKAYNRTTGELLWLSEENILQDLVQYKFFGGETIKDEVWGYVLNNTLYLGVVPGGFIYSVDILWRPNKNYISKANLYNSLAYCYNKISNQKKSVGLLENIIGIYDQQNEAAFQQLSDIYLTNGNRVNYIKNQIGFHELVYYDEIKRGNIENQLTQTSGLKWVQHFKREHDFAVHFPDRNLVVAGLCSDGGGCTLKYFRDGSGILIGENNLDLNRCKNVSVLDNRLVFIGEKDNDDGGVVASLFAIDPLNQAVINKVFLWDVNYSTQYIYHFDDLYLVDSDNRIDRSRNLAAVNIKSGALLWQNKYEYNLLYRQNPVKLINNNNLIIIPLSEQFQAINLFSGEVEWVYDFDDFDGIKYIDQNSLNGDNLYFVTLDDEFVNFNLTTRETIFFSDPVYFDYKLNVAFLNHNNMLAYTHDGKILFYNNNRSEMLQSWVEDFKQPIRILDVIDDNAYIYSEEEMTITAINIENPKNKHTISLIWNPEKFFIDTKSYGIYHKKGLYFINI